VTDITKYVELLQISSKDVRYSIEILSSRLPSKNVWIKIYETVISKYNSIHCHNEERRG
jgi:hypothetical protein